MSAPATAVRTAVALMNQWQRDGAVLDQHAVLDEIEADFARNGLTQPVRNANDLRELTESLCGVHAAIRQNVTADCARKGFDSELAAARAACLAEEPRWKDAVIQWLVMPTLRLQLVLQRQMREIREVVTRLKATGFMDSVTERHLRGLAGSQIASGSRCRRTAWRLLCLLQWFGFATPAAGCRRICDDPELAADALCHWGTEFMVPVLVRRIASSVPHGAPASGRVDTFLRGLKQAALLAQAERPRQESSLAQMRAAVPLAWIEIGDKDDIHWVLRKFQEFQSLLGAPRCNRCVGWMRRVSRWIRPTSDPSVLDAWKRELVPLFLDRPVGLHVLPALVRASVDPALEPSARASLTALFESAGSSLDLNGRELWPALERLVDEVLDGKGPVVKAAEICRLGETITRRDVPPPLGRKLLVRLLEDASADNARGHLDAIAAFEAVSRRRQVGRIARRILKSLAGRPFSSFEPELVALLWETLFTPSRADGLRFRFASITHRVVLDGLDRQVAAGLDRILGVLRRGHRS